MKVVMSVGSRNTACGHNDFCSVRLNGPIWWFILTHRYRLSLSQFTEAVLVESATGATFATQKQESPDAKVSCPFGCCRIIKAYRYYQSQQFCYFRNNRLFQIVPKQEGAMNTQRRRHDIYSSQVYRCASLLNEFKPWKDEHREAFHAIKWV